MEEEDASVEVRVVVASGEEEERAAFDRPLTEAERGSLERVLAEMEAQLDGRPPLRCSPSDVAALDEDCSDYVVVPVFQGPLFRRLAESRLRVFGPPVVLEVLGDERERALPRRARPVFSAALLDAAVSFTGVAGEVREELTTLVHHMGGLVMKDFSTETTTHLVAEEQGSAKYRVAANHARPIPILQPDWIREAWRRSLLLELFDGKAEAFFGPFRLPAFAGVTATVSGLERPQRAQLQTDIEAHGGFYSGVMDPTKTTHLITNTLSNSKKVDAARRFNCKIVDKAWVEESVKKGVSLDEKLFPPRETKAAKPPPEIRSSTPTSVSDSQPRRPPDPDVSNISRTDGAAGGLEDTRNASPVPPQPTNRRLPRITECTERTKRTERSANRSALEKENDVSGRQNGESPKGKTSELAVVQLRSLDASVCPDPELLENCVVYLAGFTPPEEEKLKRLLNAAGGSRAQGLNRRVTHLLIGDHRPTQKELNFIAEAKAKPSGPAILALSWLVESFQKGALEPSEAHLHGLNSSKAASTPGQGSPAGSRSGSSGKRRRAPSGADATPKAARRETADLQETVTPLPGGIGEPSASSTPGPTTPGPSTPLAPESPAGRLVVPDSLRPNATNRRVAELRGSGPQDASPSPTSKDLAVPSPVPNCPSPSAYGADKTFIPRFDFGDQGRELEKESFLDESAYIARQLRIANENMARDSREGSGLGLEEEAEEETGPLAGVVVNVAQRLILRCSDLHAACRKLGGSHRWQLDADCTHFVFEDLARRRDEPDDDLRTARSRGLAVVSPEWLVACARAAQRLPEADFPPSAKAASAAEQPKDKSPKPARLSKSAGLPQRRSARISRSPAPQPPSPMSKSATEPETLPPDESADDARSSFSEGNARPRTVQREDSATDPVDVGTSAPPLKEIDLTHGDETLANLMSEVVKKARSSKESFSQLPNQRPSIVAALAASATDTPKSSASPVTLPPKDPESLQVEWLDSLATSEPREKVPRPPPPAVPAPAEPPRPIPSPSPELDATVAPSEEVPEEVPAEVPAEVSERRESVEVSAVTNESCGASRRVVVVSGLSASGKAAAEEAVEELGGEITADALLATHLVLGEGLARNEKVVVSVAKGSWILHEDFLARSREAGRWLAEVPFEWGSEAAGQQPWATAERQARAAHFPHWRRRAAERRAGAFDRWTAVLVGRGEKLEPFRRILSAGGARVRDWAPGEDFAGVSHVLCAGKDPQGWDLAAELPRAMAQGARLYNSKLIADFLAAKGELSVDAQKASLLPECLKALS